MHERGDLVCLHEPFMYYYYLNQNKREMPHFTPEKDHATTYEGVKQMILSKAQQSPVFIKDMSYYISEEIRADHTFKQQITHCFLIRNPVASIASYYALDKEVSLEEIGFEAQWNHYHHLSSLGIKPVVIQAEVLCADTRSVVSQWWKSIGLPYIENAFTWGDKYPENWESVKTWHRNAISSSSIQGRTALDSVKEQNRFDLAVNSAPHLQGYLDHHAPYYEKLKSVAVSIHRAC